MNKPLRHLETGSYQPISQKPLALPRLMSLEEVATRRISALLADVGLKPISMEGEHAASIALERLGQRVSMSDEHWIDGVATEYATIRD